MSRQTWIEVALNGGAPRHLQPKIPISTREIVAAAVGAAKAGAAVIHFHVRDEASGQQVEDFALYARVIEQVRSQVDVIIYPTIPLRGPAAERFATSRALAERGLLEWSVVDPGAVNFVTAADVERGQGGWLYENTSEHVCLGLGLAEEFGLHPTFSIYEPGFVRLGSAWARKYSRLRKGIFRFMFSDDFTFGARPTRRALEAYVECLRSEAPSAEWMMGGLLFDASPLLHAAVELGGHLRVGLEDAPFDSELDNVGWVERAATAITRHGAVATAAQVRSRLREGPGTDATDN